MFGLGFLGKLGALASSVARAWSPLALWPDGIDSPGMWISPRDLTSQWADYIGTTPVAVPGTVADSANPVGLALDIRAGAPEVLGPELVVNGDFSDGATGWTLEGEWTVGSGQASITNASNVYVIYQSGLTAGKTYLASFTISSISAGRLSFYCGGSFFSAYFTTTGTHTAILVCGANGILGVQAGDTGTTAAFDNVSFQEVPGNHMLQSTSTSRPLLSARVNLLNYSEDFSNGYWKKNGVSPFGSGSVENATTAPDGTLTADKITSSATTAAVVSNNESGISVLSGTAYSASCYFKSAGKGFAYIQINAVAGPFTAAFVAVDLSTGVVGSVVNLVGSFAATNVLATPEDNGFYRLVFTVTTNAGNTDLTIYNGISDSISDRATTIDSSNGIYVWGAQLAIGDAATDYQAILTDGSTYPSTGFPIAQKYDGVDDGMATAAFAAGTLIDGMDCLIAVRWDSAALPAIGGLYQADQTKYFGVIGIASGDTAQTYGGCGTPTIFVDGVSVANTRGALFDALTVGDFHILEYRGLDLSAWVDANFGKYGGPYNFNGPRGDILLYPSTTPTEDKDAARQWLADYYGVTLP